MRIFISRYKSFISHMSMQELCEKLPRTMFARIHRSYIINITGAISYRIKKIYLGDKEISIGVSYEAEVKKIFGLD